MTLAQPLADLEPNRLRSPRSGTQALRRYVGIIADWRLRIAIGFSIATLAVVGSTARAGTKDLFTALSVFGAAWLVAVWLTD